MAPCGQTLFFSRFYRGGLPTHKDLYCDPHENYEMNDHKRGPQTTPNLEYCALTQVMACLFLKGFGIPRAHCKVVFDSKGFGYESRPGHRPARNNRAVNLKLTIL